MDLTFDTENGRFNYRVGAIIIHDKKILMVKSETAPYYYSVGGRVKINESSASAVLREAKEETGVDFGIDKLGFVLENFFIEEVTKVQFHEISFFYYLKPLSNIESIESLKDGLLYSIAKNKLKWIPLADIESYHLYPQFFKTELHIKNNAIRHIVVKENDL